MAALYVCSEATMCFNIFRVWSECWIHTMSRKAGRRGGGPLSSFWEHNHPETKLLRLPLNRAFTEMPSSLSGRLARSLLLNLLTCSWLWRSCLLQYRWQEMEGTSQLKTQIFPVMYSNGNLRIQYYMGTSNKFTVFQSQQPSPVSFKDLCGKKLLSDEYGLFCAVLEV